MNKIIYFLLIINLLYFKIFSSLVISVSSDININQGETFSSYFQPLNIPENTKKIIFKSPSIVNINLNSGSILDFSYFQGYAIEFSKNINLNISKGSKILLNSNKIIFNNIVSFS
jgi:hypothetical protein